MSKVEKAVEELEPIRKTLEDAKVVLEMVREFSKWTRREYTILVLGFGMGVGFVSMILWIINYIQLLIILGLWW